MDIDLIKTRVQEVAGEIGSAGFTELVWMLWLCQTKGIEVEGFWMYDSMFDYFYEVCAYANLSFIDDCTALTDYYEANQDGVENNYIVDMAEGEDLAIVLWGWESLHSSITKQYSSVLEKIEASLLPHTVEEFCAQYFLIVDSEESMGQFLYSAEKILEMHSILIEHGEQLKQLKKQVEKARRNRLLFRIYQDLVGRFKETEISKERLLALLIEDPYRFQPFACQPEALSLIKEHIDAAVVGEDYLHAANILKTAEEAAVTKRGLGRWLSVADPLAIYKESITSALTEFRLQMSNVTPGSRKLAIEYYVYLLKQYRKEFFELAKHRPLFARYVFRGGYLFVDIGQDPSDTSGTVVKWGERPTIYRGQVRKDTSWYDIVPSEKSIEGWIKFKCGDEWIFGAIGMPKLKVWLKCGRPDLYWEFPNRSLARPSGEYSLVLTEKVYLQGKGFIKHEKAKTIKRIVKKIRKRPSKINGCGRGGA